MNLLKYFATLFLFTFLAVVDVFLFVIVLCMIDDGSVAGIVVGIVFFVAFSYLTKKCYSFHKKYSPIKNDKSDVDLKQNKTKENGLKPDYEISYENSDGEISRRKIAVESFDGKVIEAYCFLRNEERTFYVPRITECIDLSTGEVISEDLRTYFASKFNLRLKPCDIYHYDEWAETSYKTVPELPRGLHEFELDEKLNLEIVRYKEGNRKELFYCGRIFTSSFDADKYYIQLQDSNGEWMSVGFSKILSVNENDDFISYVLRKFYASDKGRAEKLIDDYTLPLSILIHLGRADSSMSAAKRKFICNYLQSLGADCPDEILVKASRRVKVDLSDFKKNVIAYVKLLDDDKKSAFLSTAESVVGGKEKAKPFGLAALLFLESKMKN